MKTPKRQKRKGVTAEEHEEHVISILVKEKIYNSYNWKVVYKFFLVHSF